MACEQGEAVGSINPYALYNKTLRLLSVVKLSHLKLTLRIRETVGENIQSLVKQQRQKVLETPLHYREIGEYGLS